LQQISWEKERKYDVRMKERLRHFAKNDVRLHKISQVDRM
jgi:hypothetical protein